MIHSSPVLVAALLAGIAMAGPGMAGKPATVWPVEGLYGFERTACSPSSGAITAMIDPTLCAVLSGELRSRAGQRFAAAIRARFPNAVDRFAANLPSEASPRAKLSSALVASLRLTRADIWTVSKPGGTDGYLPITLTLDITNAATGEVVFTRTRSEVGQGIYPEHGVRAALAAQLPAQLDRMIDALVQESAAVWKPHGISATVVGKAGDDWVVDRGTQAGLRTDDSIGDDGTVVFSGPDYAIVRPALGTYVVGQVLEKTSFAANDAADRPSVLTVVTAMPANYGATYLTQIFEDAVSAKTRLSPMPVNPGFSALRGIAMGEARMAASDARPIPDYVAAVSVTALRPSEFASNIPGVRIKRHLALAFVSMVDRTGRVVWTGTGTAKIDDQLSGDASFSDDQRRDTVIRNALVDAAGKLGGFRPMATKLPVQLANGTLVIADEAGSVPSGARFSVLRPAGKVGRIAAIFYPVGEVETGRPVSGGIEARDIGIVPYRASRDDVVMAAGDGPAMSWRQPVMRCRAEGQARIDDRGTIAIDAADPMADALIAASFPGPVRREGLAAALIDLRLEFANWDRFAPAQEVRSTRCYRPVVAVTDSAAPGKLEILAGYQLFDGATKVGGNGQQVTLNRSSAMPGIGADDARALQAQDIAQALIPLFENAGKGLLGTTAGKGK